MWGCGADFLAQKLGAGGHCTLTKETIPDDKDASKVLVDAIAVDTVVNSMVTGCIQNIFQRSYLTNRLHRNITIQMHGFTTARRTWKHVHSAIYAMIRCLSIRPSFAGVLSKWPHGSSWFWAQRLSTSYPSLRYKWFWVSIKIRALVTHRHTGMWRTDRQTDTRRQHIPR